MTAEQQTALCRDRYGFWIAPGPGGQVFLFVPAGHDPGDGAPLTYARVASQHEVALWEAGKLDRLASLVSPSLPRQHAPSATARKKPRGVWGKLLDALWVGKHRNN
jgi:hypothetical protein